MEGELMRVLVTGGAGFIGSAVVRALLDRHRAEVAVLDCMTYAASPQTLAAHRKNPGFTFHQHDICNAAAVHAAVSEFKPDTIIHLAAESHVDRSIERPAKFVDTNVVGTQVLLDAALAYWKDLPSQRKAAFRFIHVSTDEVYGALGETGAFTETTPYAPRSPYSASKAASDHLAHAWRHTFGLPTIVTNCSNNYGPYQFPEKLIPLMILRGIAGQSMPVYGRGQNVRDWLFVDDHAEALWLVASEGRPGETYLIGGESERRNIDVVTTIATLLDEMAPQHAPHSRLITYVDDRPGHDHRYAIDPSKIKRELGWRPRAAFDAGLQQTVQWYLDNRHWWEPILSNTYRLERLGAAP
jgi:dTDP-glucose 4,6-dehydratase